MAQYSIVRKRTEALLKFDLEDPSLQRAVPMSTILRNFGALLSAGRIPTWNEGAVASDFYGLSSEAKEFDCFISHSWSASRAHKFVALAWSTNLGPALSAAAFGAVALSLFSWSDPYEVLTTCDGVVERVGITFVLFYFMFVVLLALAHNVVRWCQDDACFFDKGCIDQAHGPVKQAQIDSLGAFLQNSRRMIVLWSPDYFHRLWCTYELAAYIHLNDRKASAIDLVPLYLPAFALTYLTAVTASLAIFLCLYTKDSPLSRETSIATALIIPYGLLALELVDIVEQRQMLEHAIKTYTVAQCQVTIEEDRPVVEGAIEHLFHDLSQDGIPNFEATVRSEVAERIDTLLGSNAFPVPLWAQSICTSPFFFFGLDAITMSKTAGFADTRSVYEDIAEYMLGPALVLPTIVALITTIVRWALARFIARKLVVKGGAVCLVFALYGGFWAGWGAFVRQPGTTPFHHAAVAVCSFLILTALRCSAGPRPRPQQQEVP